MSNRTTAINSCSGGLSFHFSIIGLRYCSLMLWGMARAWKVLSAAIHQGRKWTSIIGLPRSLVRNERPRPIWVWTFIWMLLRIISVLRAINKESSILFLCCLKILFAISVICGTTQNVKKTSLFPTHTYTHRVPPHWAQWQAERREWWMGRA